MSDIMQLYLDSREAQRLQWESGYGVYYDLEERRYVMRTGGYMDYVEAMNHRDKFNKDICGMHTTECYDDGFWYSDPYSIRTRYLDS